MLICRQAASSHNVTIPLIPTIAYVGHRGKIHPPKKDPPKPKSRGSNRTTKKKVKRNTNSRTNKRSITKQEPVPDVLDPYNLISPCNLNPVCNLLPPRNPNLDCDLCPKFSYSKCPYSNYPHISNEQNTLMSDSPLLHTLAIKPKDTKLYCYVLKSQVRNILYIGYTCDFQRRLKQHNGVLAGGAKKTSRWRPWDPIFLIYGFEDKNQALRFEYRLQHPPNKMRYKFKDRIVNILYILNWLIDMGDGSISAGTKRPWPALGLVWLNKDLAHYILENPITNKVKISLPD